MQKNLSLKDSNIFIKLIFFIFSFYPIAFLIGNLAINLASILIFIFLALGLITKKIEINFKDKILFLLIFLFICLLVNLYFSQNFNFSLPRVIKFLIIIGFVFAFRAILNNLNNQEINRLFKTWFFIFLVVLGDLIFEIMFGFNILGQKSIIPGRLTSFTGNEMVIGHFFFAFCLFVLSFIYKNYNQVFIKTFVPLLFVIISFLIGERSNFIKTFIIISLFVFFIYDINIKYKISFILISILFFTLFINLNPYYKTRYFNQIKVIFKDDGLNKYLRESKYGAHYKVAKEIFKNYPVFGVGIKNFRIESYNEKYKGILNSDDFKSPYNNWTGGTVHPHQIHYELLSETGLFGYLTFFLVIILSIYYSFRSFLLNKNLYQFSAILFVCISFLPFIPTGSFFSTYSAGLFWINYSIMVGYIGNEIKF